MANVEFNGFSPDIFRALSARGIIFFPFTRKLGLVGAIGREAGLVKKLTFSLH
jgi:hypothetical protein